MSQMPSVWGMETIWYRVTYFQGLFWQFSGYRKYGTCNQNKNNFILNSSHFGTETLGAVEFTTIHHFVNSQKEEVLQGLPSVNCLLCYLATQNI